MGQLSLLASERDNFVVPFMHQSFPWGQAKARFQLKIHPNSAPSAVLPCIPHSFHLRTPSLTPKPIYVWIPVSGSASGKFDPRQILNSISLKSHSLWMIWSELDHRSDLQVYSSCQFNPTPLHFWCGALWRWRNISSICCFLAHHMKNIKCPHS